MERAQERAIELADRIKITQSELQKASRLGHKLAEPQGPVGL